MQFNFEEDIKKTIKSASRHKVGLYFSSGSSESLSIAEKKDQSIVTDFDLSISNEIKNWKESNINLKNWTFFSEEDHSELLFPAIVLDPIDGTRELVKGRDECVVSLAIMPDSSLKKTAKSSFAYIYNPFSGFEIYTGMSNLPVISKSLQPMLGLISRSEWHLGLHNEVSKNTSDIIMAPKGSIAFKLGLLATGASDFVISFKPKSIWDIAAGTILLRERGYLFFEKGKLVENLDKVQFDPPLVWVHPLQVDRLFKNLS